jgi:hypothetical protein
MAIDTATIPSITAGLSLKNSWFRSPSERAPIAARRRVSAAIKRSAFFSLAKLTANSMTPMPRPTKRPIVSPNAKSASMYANRGMNPVARVLSKLSAFTPGKILAFTAPAQ